MSEDKVYKVKEVHKETDDIEAIVDKKIKEEPNVIPQASQPKKKGFQLPQIPTDKIFKTLTNKEALKQTLHDETLEPHVHLAILLFIIFIMAIVISLLGI